MIDENNFNGHDLISSYEMLLDDPEELARFNSDLSRSPRNQKLTFDQILLSNIKRSEFKVIPSLMVESIHDGSNSVKFKIISSFKTRYGQYLKVLDADRVIWISKKYIMKSDHHEHRPSIVDVVVPSGILSYLRKTTKVQEIRDWFDRNCYSYKGDTSGFNI